MQNLRTVKIHANVSCRCVCNRSYAGANRPLVCDGRDTAALHSGGVYLC